jgi:tricorn protease
VLFTSLPVEGTLERQPLLATPEPERKAKLEVYDLESKKVETWVDGITNFSISLDRETLIYRDGRRLRVVKTRQKPDEQAAKEPPGRKSGWVDLGRVKISIDPPAEWNQMYREAWRLQREQYWIEDMSEVDWQAVHDRYLPLVDRVGSRAEFEDLLWEMQGELGVSHAYAFGGDFRPEPRYPVGFLGADLEWDEGASVWRIKHVVLGDPADARNPPPLLRPGVNLAKGAVVLAVNNRATASDVSPSALLVNQAGAEVALRVADQPGANPRDVVVRTSRDDTLIRYREWVERNRGFVHEKTHQRCGYIHIPDMGPWGFAEFHRSFLAEVDRDGLIIDVRYNRGGHVSGLLLEKLSRRRLGYQHSRWFGVRPWPDDSPAGPMVAITNQHAGSDGDIFSYSFKHMKLGPLIGKRTWGGVIGIWPRHLLADGGLTTQPEFAFWFEGAGWDVENYGVTPDIEVDFAPQDYFAARDPQLERAIGELTKRLPNETGAPKFAPRPSRVWRKPVSQRG